MALASANGGRGASSRKIACCGGRGASGGGKFSGAFALVAVATGGARQAPQVKGAASFWTGAGQSLAAEGLHADHGAHLVAVDIEVADARLCGHLCHAALYAGVQAHGQAKAEGVDVREQLRQLLRFEAQAVQHWAKDFALDGRYLGDAKCHRGDEAPLAQLLGQRGFGQQPHILAGFHVGHIVAQRRRRLVVDDRAYVGGGVSRVAEAQLGHGAGQHGDEVVGYVLLHAQQAARGAALASTQKGRAHQIGNRLLGQCRGVDDHGVDAAGLGDQGDVHRIGTAGFALEIFGVGRLPQGLGYASGRCGRAGEADRVHQPGADQSGARRLAVADDQLQRIFGHAGGMQQIGTQGGGQGSLLGGLATTALPAARAPTTWPQKMASGKFQGEMQAAMPSGFLSAHSCSHWCA